MIRFVLNKIQLRNVRCYGDDIMEMDFPLNNLTVFTGHVGSGKSTIVKSVSMALFGEDGGVKGEKLSIDDMVNEKTGKNLEIHLYFKSYDEKKNDEETDYQIHLYHKHTSFGNKLVFMKNGQDISANGKLDTYRLIEKTLIPKQVYHNIYYFTQQAKNFFTALPNSEQKEIFDSILDLSEYDDYYNNAKEKTDELKQTEKELTTENLSLTDNKNVLLSNIKNLEDNIKNDQLRTEAQINLLNTDLEIYESQRSKLLKELENKDKSFIITEKQNEMVSFEKEKNSIEHDISKQTSNLEQLPNKHKENFEKFKLLINNKYSDKINEINERKSKLTEGYNKSKQDLILSKVDIENKSTIAEKKKTEEFDSECSELRMKWNDLKNKLSELQNEKFKMIEDINKKISEEKTARDVKINNYTVEINGLDRDLKNKKFLYDDVTKKVNDYQNDLLSETAICRSCGQPLKNKDHIKKHIDELSNQLELIKSDIDKLLSDKSKLEIEKNEEIKSKEEFIEYNRKKINENSACYDTKMSTITEEVDQISLTLIEKKDKFKNNVLDVLKRQKISLLDDIDQKINELDKQYNDNYSVIDNELKSIEKSKADELIFERDRIKEVYHSEVSSINNEINNLKDKLKQLQNNHNLKISELNNQIEWFNEKETKLNSIGNEIVVIKSKIDSLKNKFYDTSSIDNLKESLNELESKIISNKTKLDECKENIKISEFWKQAFSNAGIKSMLIDSAIPHMNECVREELDRVAPGLFTVSFDTLSETKSGNIRDKFSINIVHNIKGSTGHKKLSGGEKRIVDLCCMTALRSLAEKLYDKKFCHIFYDEILDSLDNECKEQFCRNAKLQSEDGLNITLITHDLPEDVDPDRVFPF